MLELKIGDNVTFNCSGPPEFSIQLLEIGEKLTLQDKNPAVHDLPPGIYFHPQHCSDSVCFEPVTMTVTQDMDKRAYQCRSLKAGSPPAAYSRGVYVRGT